MASPALKNKGAVCSGGVPDPGEVSAPRGCLFRGGVPGQVLPPRGQNSWHTLLKILPCPKLRLRAVKIDGLQRRPHRFHVYRPPPGCWIRYWGGWSHRSILEITKVAMPVCTKNCLWNSSLTLKFHIITRWENITQRSQDIFPTRIIYSMWYISFWSAASTLFGMLIPNYAVKVYEIACCPEYWFQVSSSLDSYYVIVITFWSHIVK